MPAALSFSAMRLFGEDDVRTPKAFVKTNAEFLEE
jgi:hypothetical protein